MSISAALFSALPDAVEYKIHATAVEGRQRVPDWHLCTSFAFVRNPWDRLVSAFQFIPVPCSFEEFVLRPRLRRFVPFQQPQTEYVNDLHGNRLVSFVGRFETLAEDFNRVCEMSGLHVDLGHINENPRRSSRRFQEMYNDETREFVARRYSDDIRQFGYVFEEDPTPGPDQTRAIATDARFSVIS